MKLLSKEPSERLGSTADGLRGIKEHPWFNDFPEQVDRVCAATARGSAKLEEIPSHTCMLSP